jgi:hypothetical protein
MKEALSEFENFKIGGRIISKVRFADTAIIAKIQDELQDMVNRLIDTGRKYGMEINIDRSRIDYLCAGSEVSGEILRKRIWFASSITRISL